MFEIPEAVAKLTKQSTALQRELDTIRNERQESLARIEELQARLRTLSEPVETSLERGTTPALEILRARRTSTAERLALTEELRREQEILGQIDKIAEEVSGQVRDAIVEQIAPHWESAREDFARALRGAEEKIKAGVRTALPDLVRAWQAAYGREGMSTLAPYAAARSAVPACEPSWFPSTWVTQTAVEAAQALLAEAGQVLSRREP